MAGDPCEQAILIPLQRKPARDKEVIEAARFGIGSARGKGVHSRHRAQLVPGDPLCTSVSAQVAGRTSLVPRTHLHSRHRVSMAPRALSALLCAAALRGVLAISPKELAAWFAAPGGLAMGVAEAQQLADQSWHTLTQCGVTVGAFYVGLRV